MTAIGFFYGNETFPPDAGAAIHRYQLSKNLRERGNELLCWYYTNGTDPYCSHLRGREVFRLLRAVNAIYVRVEWTQRRQNIVTATLARLASVPLIWELNGTPSELLHIGWDKEAVSAVERHLRRLAPRVSACVGVSDSVANYAKEVLGIESAFAVQNGSDPELFRPLQGNADRSNPLEVAWAGTSSLGWHDLPTLIETARILEGRSANVRFRIFGDANNLPNDLPQNIVPRGIVPYLELGKELGTADVGVHLFKAVAQPFGSPLKVFDYMSCGLALITNQTGDAAAFTAQGAGLSADDPEALVNILQQLEADREGCRRLGARGRQLVTETFNWRRTAREVEDIILRSISGAAPGTSIGTTSAAIGPR